MLKIFIRIGSSMDNDNPVKKRKLDEFDAEAGEVTAVNEGNLFSLRNCFAPKPFHMLNFYVSVYFFL